jgi:hypothetical protein
MRQRRVLGSKTAQQEDTFPSGGTNSDPQNSLRQSSGPCAVEYQQPLTTTVAEMPSCRLHRMYPTHMKQSNLIYLNTSEEIK